MSALTFNAIAELSLPSLSGREWLAAAHGMFFGGLFLLAFSGGLYCLILLGSKGLNEVGTELQLKWLNLWSGVQALNAWATTLTGAFIIYPWYRAKLPQGGNLAEYPQAFLAAHPALAPWHSFGMEWKEHLAWFAPILATGAYFLVKQFGHRLTESKDLRTVCIALYSLCFATAAIAGLLGAEITKAAAVK